MTPHPETVHNSPPPGHAGEPDIKSLVTALEGLKSSKKKKPKISFLSSSPNDRDQDQDQDHQISQGPGYLSTPALHSSTPCTPSSSTSVATPSSAQSAQSALGGEVEHNDAATWYQLTQIKDRGVGLVAARRIPAGTLILSEPALIKIPLWLEENDKSAIETAVRESLSKSERKQYLQLCNAKSGGGQMSQASGIYNSNCYDIRAFDDQGGSCIGLISSRINHSCLPNVAFSYIPASQVTTAMTAGLLSPVDETNALRRGLMQFRAIKNISKGKELLGNYEKSIFAGRKARMDRLRRYYGFDCSCEACAPTSEFWQKSDARRKAMEECVRAGATYEREWMTDHDGGDKKKKKEKGEEEEQLQLAANAIAKLQKLEGLLLKEGLTYTPLANCYKSLAKWTARVAQNADEEKAWLEKELEVVTRCFGRDSLRAQTLIQSLHPR